MKSNCFSTPIKQIFPGIQKCQLSPIFNLTQNNHSNDSLPGNLEGNILVPQLKILQSSLSLHQDIKGKKRAVTNYNRVTVS